MQDIKILQVVLHKADIVQARKVNELQPSLQKGLAEYLILKCSWCGYETNFSTSMKIKINNSKLCSTRDFNVRSTYASQMMGREGLSKFCSIMDMSPPTKVISSTAVNKAGSPMKKKQITVYLCV